MLSVYANGENKSLSFTPTSSEIKNSCEQDVNFSYIDLSELNITNGASVHILRFDNRGNPGCCSGSDIAGINFTSSMSNIKGNNSSNVLSVDQWNIPLMMPMPSNQ